MKFEHGILKNGTRWTFSSMECGSVAVLFDFEIGLKDEHDGQNGIMHLSEHLLVRHLLPFAGQFGIWTNGFVTREHLVILVQAKSDKAQEAICKTSRKDAIYNSRTNKYRD